MSIKLFVFDMDGTLLNSNREIIKENIDTLKKLHDKGHHIMIATGRNFCQLDSELKMLPFVKYVATINGGILTNTELMKNEIMSSPLNKEIIETFKETAIRIKRELQWSNENNFYRVFFGKNPREDIKDKDFFHGGTKDPSYDKWEDVKQTLEQPILHMAVKCEREFLIPEIDRLRKLWEPLNVCTITETSKCYIDCDPLGINKFKAIQKVQKYLNISNENTYAFGDSNNDKIMIESCGYGIAMGNAREEIKAIANFVIGTNEEPSISKFLKEKFINEQ